MQIIKKLLYLLTPKEQRNASLLMIMVLGMAFLDMLGVASILPFTTVMSNPDLIESNIFLNKAFKTAETFGVETKQDFIFILGILVFIMLIVSLVFKAITLYIQTLFVLMRTHSIARRLVEGYLNQPYSWFLNRNSSELGKNILSEVSTVTGSGMNTLIELIKQYLVTFAILGLLIIYNPKLTLIAIFTLGGVYGLIYFFTRVILKSLGKEHFDANEARFKSLSEAFGSAKEIKMGGLEKTFVERFSIPSLVIARNLSLKEFISFMPRFLLEALVFGGMILVILYLMVKSGSFVSSVPTIALYAFAGYRLMPALQKIYSSTTTLRFVGPAVDNMYEDFKKLKPSDLNQEKNILKFTKNITLKNIHYNYPNSSRKVLKNINLIIPVNSTVGIIGPTGCGKTTAVDVILGLLEAQEGTLEVDNQIIDKKNIRSWQRSIGYVPQHIYLADDTIAANIAFGAETENIQQINVERASKIACVHDFVTNELPLKYQTSVGERGVRLSGGQRQRIGIARALYHNPKILILDEATSALDIDTEKAVIDAINKINKEITIILITHRLNTLKNCDIIFKLDKGEIVDKGTFNKLISSN